LGSPSTNGGVEAVSVADAQDLEERAEHPQQVLGAVLDYIEAIVADTKHVASGGSIDRKYLLGMISDLACDVAGSPIRSSDGWTPQLPTFPTLVNPLAEPYARAAPVLGDELDAARIQSRLNLFYRIGSSAQVPIRRLKSSDRWF
jgi:hypothetical protein